MPSIKADYKRLIADVAQCTACTARCRAIRELVNGGKPFIPLPNLDPHPGLKSSGVTVLFVAMEPTTNQWVEDDRMKTARRLVAAGMRNHGPTAMHIAVRDHLLAPGESYLLTDAAKCALPAKGAGASRKERTQLCRDHLIREVKILRPKVIVALGGKTEQWLRRVAREVEREGAPVLPEIVRMTHFSPQSIGPTASTLASRHGVLRLQSRESLDARFAQIHREQRLPAAYQRRAPYKKHDANLIAVYREELKEVRAALRRARS